MYVMQDTGLHTLHDVNTIVDDNVFHEPPSSPLLCFFDALVLWWRDTDMAGVVQGDVQLWRKLSIYSACTASKFTIPHTCVHT